MLNHAESSFLSSMNIDFFTAMLNFQKLSMLVKQASVSPGSGGEIRWNDFERLVNAARNQSVDPWVDDNVG